VPNDHRIHQSVLHSVATGVVDDPRVGNALRAELEGVEAGTLVAGAGFFSTQTWMDRPAVAL